MSLYVGTALAHYADKGPNRGTVAVSIDGLPYQNATWTNVEVTSGGSANVEYQQQMWYVNKLSPGDHQIVVGNVGTGDPTTSMMGIDYFQYVGCSFAC